MIWFTELTTSPNITQHECSSHRQCSTNEICTTGICTNPCIKQCGKNKCTVEKHSPNAVKIICLKENKTKIVNEEAPNIGKTLNPKFPDFSTETNTEKTTAITSTSITENDLTSKTTTNKPFTTHSPHKFVENTKTSRVSHTKEDSTTPNPLFNEIFTITKSTSKSQTNKPFTTSSVRPITSKYVCTSSMECQRDQACINNNCVNPCKDLSPCDSGFLCKVVNHKVSCQCPTESSENSKCTKGKNMNNNKT